LLEDAPLKFFENPEERSKALRKFEVPGGRLEPDFCHNLSIRRSSKALGAWAISCFRGSAGNMIYRFGDCQLDPDLHELKVGGEPRTVEPQVFDLLLYLVENRDRVVTKDDLHEAIWQGRIVSEANLSNRVALARQAVGDDGKTQALIKTFSRRGFRFVGKVEACGAAMTEAVPAATGPIADVGSRSDKPSIAVLPFENMSGDPEQEYFSDGMAEDLITDISKISGLFVIARNSSFAFKGQSSDVKDIAERLGVKSILEGSVRKMGPKLRVNAQLVDAASGGPVWAERYDGDMADIFEFQKALAERKPTDSVEAHDLFLRGRASYHRYTPEDLRDAMKCFEAAIKIDPNFADAYGYLSYCYFYGWANIWSGFDDSLDRAYELAERGVTLNDTSAIALTRLGWVQTFMRRYDDALTNLEKAVALAPGNAEVYATFGQVLNYAGDPERGLLMAEKAFGIDTVVPPVWEYQLGLSHLMLRHYDQAIAGFKRAVERAPKFLHGYLTLIWAYVETDRRDEADEAINTVLKVSPHYTLKVLANRLPYGDDDVRTRIFESLRKAGLPEG
jgi:TolB-like protein/Tfp pilus assembly protein PilF